ncbi:MAG: sugar ABC transporter permease [Sphaerochaeta sp.]|nr:sugar ABC transporter permease [Sphaerochaeta sp.]
MEGKIEKKSGIRTNAILLALVSVMVLFEILIRAEGKGSLFAPANISNLINQNAYVVILAVGMLLCILTGGNIDLSVGSIVCLVGAVAGTLIVNMGMNIYLAIIICLLFGILLGAWQGYWIAYVRIPPFIVTLAGMLLFRGLANVILNGLTISPFPENYLRLFTSYIPESDNDALQMTVSLSVAGVICILYVISEIASRKDKIRKGYATESSGAMITKTVLICAFAMAFATLLGLHKGLPIVLVWLAVIIFVYGYFTNRTVPGRYFYAMGGNEKAAILSGIDTNKVLFFAYTNMAFLSAIAALVCCARFNSATPSAGTSYEMDAIGSCFIGGASAYGGSGTVGGAIVGALLMGVLNNGMSILGIDANWQKAVKGLVLLAAVIFDVLSKKRRKND